MTQPELLFSLSILSCFVCLLLALFLFSVKNERPLANHFLAWFLLLTAIDVSGWALAGFQLNRQLETFRVTLAYLQMPLFLGFFYASCQADFKLKKQDALHALPFLIVLILSVQNLIDWPLVNAFLHLQYYIYIGVALHFVIQARAEFRSYYSDQRSELFAWLLQLIFVSLFVHTLVLIRSVLFIEEVYTYFFILQVVGAVLVLVVTSWITLKALLEPELFRGVDSQNIKYSRSEGSARDSAHDLTLAAQLKTFMQTNEPHLDSELTLRGLAEQLALSPRDLSELINSQFKMHFFDFVNIHRIDSAKSILMRNKTISILEVLHAVGFNTKSSFNTAFKKNTGQTPTEFRKSTSIGS